MRKEKILQQVRTKFSSAHLISNYDGKCSNIHGHTWKVNISIIGSVRKESGMIVDFSYIKNIIKERYDHTLLICKNDRTNETINFLSDKCYSMTILNVEPTAENLAVEIAQLLSKKINNSSIKSIEVELFESDTSSVIYIKRQGC